MRLPRGEPHTFANLGDEPVEAFGAITPAGLEGMFRETEDYVADLVGPPDPADLAEIGGRYGVTALGPGLLQAPLPRGSRHQGPHVRVTLREITEQNRDAVLGLRTTAAQERFVSTVASSLDEAERHPDEHPWLRAIYAGEQPVGFVMVAWDFVPEPPHTDGPFFLWKLLIDHRYQGRGYGKQAVEQVIDLIRADGGRELITSYVEGEGNPFGFYTKLGFVPRGDLDPEGEIMLRLPLLP